MSKFTNKYPCRFYKNRYPEVDDVIMVDILNIAEMGAYVSLLEYQNMEGMVLLSELSRRRIRSINKLIKIGRQECVVVIRVDTEKGYIDLSKRRVSPEDIKLCEDRYMRAKTVFSIMRYAAELLNLKTTSEFEDLVDRVVWKLDEIHGGKSTSYYAFHQMSSDSSILDKCEITERERKAIENSIRSKMEMKKIKIRADIEVACYRYEGVNAVKNALQTGLDVCKDQNDISIKINLIAPPVYVVTIITKNRELGMRTIKQVLDTVEGTIKTHDGFFKIKVAAKVVTDIEDAELVRKMAELERANKFVDGDNDDDDDEENPEDIDTILDDKDTAARFRGSNNAATADETTTH